MTITATRGHISFAIQSAKIGNGAFNPTTVTWKRHRMTSADFAVQEMIRSIAPELGGGMFLSSTYKVGVALMGGATFEPRLQNSLGHLLFGASGDYVYTAAAASQSPIHTFRVDPADPALLPWMCFRKYTPAANNSGTDGQTEYGVDCRLVSLVLRIPQAAAMTAEAQFVGRRPIAVDGEFSTGNPYEGGEGLALSCKSSVELTDFAPHLPGAVATGGTFTGAEITILNNFTTPQDEMILGSYYPDDFVPLFRAATIRLIYKVADHKLYRHLYYKAPSPTQREWKEKVERSPVTITAASASNISSTYTHPYRLIFSASKVDWSISPIRLLPREMLLVELVGQVLEPDTGPAWQIDLHNDAPDYSL